MEQFKLSLKKINFTKWRLLWILIAAAWLFVFLKLLVGAIFEKNTSLVAAFSVTNPQEISASVEVTAKYPLGDLSDKNKLLVIEEMADAIGLILDVEPEVTESETRQEISFFKDALAADTEVKVITLYKDNSTGIGEQENAVTYLYAKISLNQSLETVLAYKTLLEETLGDLSCTEISTTIQLVGDYAGYLPLERRNEITADILDALGAEVVYEYREHELYTVYGYTAGLDNYITVDNKKINVHIAMSQNEEHYRTVLYLASPILPDTW
ncbi:MAG: YwmB family TATA-box binding protein [Lachnospiraceae bacterium]|nr:YwmB family TATA-box binding protein [Lachnospiraceae bacterium]